MSILMKRKRKTIMNIKDFEKKYVTSVHFHDGDKILVTEENIEHLRQALKDENFEWVSGYHIIEGELFQPDIIINLDELNSQYIPITEAYKHDKYKNAINYVFVNY